MGVAEFPAPAATAGALWLISYRHDAQMSTAANAQEVTVTGTALGPRLRLPAGYLIDQGTRAGLLLVQELAGPGRYELSESRPPARDPVVRAPDGGQARLDRLHATLHL